MKLTRFLFLVFAISYCSLAQAKYTQTCKVKYRTQYGWSDGYTVDVNFLTGYELNDATSSFNYNSYSVYAVIFWGDGEASVIKLSGYLSCGSEATQRCISSSYGSLTGEDQSGRQWKICTSGYCY